MKYKESLSLAKSGNQIRRAARVYEASCVITEVPIICGDASGNINVSGCMKPVPKSNSKD
jgi:hypothetical protein